MRAVDVLRVANVLQDVYFSAEQIALGVQNLRERCRGENSLIVVCRNAQRGLEASVLRMTADRSFIVEGRIGPGSEVERYFTA